MTEPHFQLLCLPLRGDLLWNVPVKFARNCARLLDLDLYLPPVLRPIVEMRMYWHRRVERDPAQAWRREKITAAMDLNTEYPPADLCEADTLKTGPQELRRGMRGATRR